MTSHAPLTTLLTLLGTALLASPPAHAQPNGTCRVTGAVASSEYAKLGGAVERSIVYITDTATGRPVANSLSLERRFTFDLPPGNYKLQCTANGSKGATFVPTYRIFAVGEGEKLDLGTIDLPVSVTTRLFGKPAPELAGLVEWKHTKPVTLKQLRGKVVVLDFWAHYCSICHAHKPDLAKLYDKYREKGLQVLAIHDNTLSSMEEVDRRMQKVPAYQKHHLPIGLDGVKDSVCRAYGITAVPAVILIDQQGNVVRRFHHAGKPELEEAIAALLAKPTSH